jgi:CubicO group peptidase (beta-lactamase class C family)
VVGLGQPARRIANLLAANDRGWRAAEIPAANCVATARAMARLYACLARGGELDGVRLLSPASVAEAGRCHVRGHVPYRDDPIAYGLGFHMREDDGDALGPEPDAFGHGGAGGSIHGCWPRLRTGFSYTTNLLDGAGNPRTAALASALHSAIEREA